jgi:hypothetical protein
MTKYRENKRKGELATPFDMLHQIHNPKVMVFLLIMGFLCLVNLDLSAGSFIYTTNPQ